MRFRQKCRGRARNDAARRGPVNARSRQAETADPFGPAAFVTRVTAEATFFRSFALMAGLLHGLKDAVEVVGFRRLHRRELLVRHQLLFPEQLADRQDIPVVEIGGAWRAKRTG